MNGFFDLNILGQLNHVISRYVWLHLDADQTCRPIDRQIRKSGDFWSIDDMIRSEFETADYAQNSQKP